MPARANCQNWTVSPAFRGLPLFFFSISIVLCPYCHQGGIPNRVTRYGECLAPLPNSPLTDRATWLHKPLPYPRIFALYSLSYQERCGSQEGSERSFGGHWVAQDSWACSAWPFPCPLEQAVRKSLLLVFR